MNWSVIEGRQEGSEWKTLVLCRCSGHHFQAEAPVNILILSSLPQCASAHQLAFSMSNHGVGGDRRGVERRRTGGERCKVKVRFNVRLVGCVLDASRTWLEATRLDNYMTALQNIIYVWISIVRDISTHYSRLLGSYIPHSKANFIEDLDDTHHRIPPVDLFLLWNK